MRNADSWYVSWDFQSNFMAYRFISGDGIFIFYFLSACSPLPFYCDLIIRVPASPFSLVRIAVFDYHEKVHVYNFITSISHYIILVLLYSICTHIYSLLQENNPRIVRYAQVLNINQTGLNVLNDWKSSSKAIGNCFVN